MAFREDSESQRLLSLASESDVAIQGFRSDALAKYDLTPKHPMAR
jgi:crotonobetainyl-CoA:carnitine CoA-transferase CaiB-like acyl-CoA transferase